MSADDLRTVIRTDVLADEPPFAMSGSRWREPGARVVRRRRRVHVATSLVAVGFLAGAVMIVPRLHVGVDAGGGTDMLAKAQRALDEFDRDTFPQVFDAEVRHALGDSLPESVEGRVEPTLGGWTRLRPADYAYTDAWTATYELSPTDRLVVMLQHDQSANEGDAQRECREDLKNGWMERCTAGALDDGSVAISEVYKVQHTAVGFRPGAKGGPETWWYARQVFDRRDYGFGVVAREYVKATSLAEADRLWATTDAQLETLVASPNLVYQLPKGGKRSCDTTYLLPASDEGFARVVCENTLN